MLDTTLRSKVGETNFWIEEGESLEPLTVVATNRPKSNTSRRRSYQCRRVPLFGTRFATRC